MSRQSIFKEGLSTIPTSLDGWDPLSENIVTNPTIPLSTTTSQSVSNQLSPPATASHGSTISTSRSFNVNQTNLNVASVRETPPNGRQGLVKKVERNNSGPFMSTRSHKFVPIGTESQQTSAALPFNVELHLKQTQELLVECRNAHEILEKKNDDLKLDHLELKSNCINANKSIEELKADSTKLHDKLDQLIKACQANANINIKQEYDDGETAFDDVASDHVKMELKEEFEEETIEQQGDTTQQITDTTTNSNNRIETNQQVDCNELVIKGEFDFGQEFEIKQEDEEEEDQTTDSEDMVEIKEEEEEEEEGETAQQILDISNNVLTEARQVAQIGSAEFESPPNQNNLVDLFDVEGEGHFDTRYSIY